jgi:hypothetical protein
MPALICSHGCDRATQSISTIACKPCSLPAAVAAMNHTGCVGGHSAVHSAAVHQGTGHPVSCNGGVDATHPMPASVTLLAVCVGHVQNPSACTAAAPAQQPPGGTQSPMCISGNSTGRKRMVFRSLCRLGSATASQRARQQCAGHLARGD